MAGYFVSAFFYCYFSYRSEYNNTRVSEGILKKSIVNRTIEASVK